MSAIASTLQRIALLDVPVAAMREMLSIVADLIADIEGSVPIARMSRDSTEMSRDTRDRAEAKRAADRARLAKKRAAAVASVSRDTCDVSRDSTEMSRDTAGPLSPSTSSTEEDISLTPTRAREGNFISNDLVPMTEGWEPDGNGRQLASELLGEAATAACLGKFRDHWQAESGPRGRRTPRQWQAAWRKWVRAECDFTVGPQRNLALVRPINGGGGTRHGPRSLATAADELIARAEERAGGAAATGPPGNGLAATG